MSLDGAKPRQSVLVRSLISLAGMMVVLSLLMFLPANAFWLRGCIFVLVFCVAMALGTAYLWRANPEIFVARGSVHRGTKPWDKLVLVLVVVSFFAIFSVAGFDVRNAWSSVPTWLPIVGYALFMFGFAVTIWVYSVNKFAEPTVRIQTDRGQRVIDTGPYALIRHPLYMASAFLVVGIALALGSYWALVPVGVGGIAIFIRTIFEDRTLRRELAGYEEYASRVRYRLIPGVW